MNEGIPYPEGVQEVKQRFLSKLKTSPPPLQSRGATL